MLHFLEQEKGGKSMISSDKVLTQLQKMLSNTILACKIVLFLV